MGLKRCFSGTMFFLPYAVNNPQMDVLHVPYCSSGCLKKVFRDSNEAATTSLWSMHPRPAKTDVIGSCQACKLRKNEGALHTERRKVRTDWHREGREAPTDRLPHILCGRSYRQHIRKGVNLPRICMRTCWRALAAKMQYVIRYATAGEIFCWNLKRTVAEYSYLCH